MPNIIPKLCAIFPLEIQAEFCYNLLTESEREKRKMTEKNLKKALAKKQRVWYNMNTGTQNHKDAKHPSRQKMKKDLKKMLDS